MTVILDASVTLAWVFGDETSPAVRQVFESVAEHGAVVPNLWWLEVANSLTMAVRRKRVDRDFRDAALRDLAILDLTTDPQTATQAWSATLALADQHRLTVYDAVYLELAARRRLPLATLDQDLREAAKKESVTLAVAPT
jgi:predicted nucleic acid-binding protein